MNRTQSFISAVISFIAIFIAPYIAQHGMEVDVPTVENALITLVGFAFFIWSCWKNHNITDSAMEAQELLHELKNDIGEDCEGKEE